MAMRRTIIQMINKAAEIAGGKDKVAFSIGLTESELNNRMYQTKGQRFKDEELIAIQHEYGLTDYTDELCRQAGGVFVKTLVVDELDSVELSTKQVQELAVRGMLFSALDSAMSDGEITSQEEDRIRKILHKHLSATCSSIEFAISLYKK
ncbi:hypothetical protein NMW45_07430 [Pasteurella multocida]|uniref:YmfL family putative regulatory protein n=1 Tax=Pasteurella multocida TaxID=747 RepID=UPI000C7A49E4|nr:YmfL family putative regulatory protein [Pasteurella multocida]AUK49141.1 hypothetical protein A4210_05030 [Pasteurella multocida]AUK53750.1 hypothetical protein A4204_05035 [Pasteurella multocida]MDH7436226.1 YmfL family putative regulatory protein [Pasteurella multocida]MDH7439973.1 YmfL family putative regulatory protein [Pasteurella multocida]MDY0428837.1 hypothetical protein [Pasteurella multocida]